MNNKANTLLLETEPFATSYASQEIKNFLGKEVKLLDKHILTLKTEDLTEDLIKLTLFSETIKRIHLFLGQIPADDLSVIYSEMKGIEWYNLFDETLTFAIRSIDVSSEIPFNPKEIEREAGQAIVDLFKEVKNKRIKVRLESPDIEIYLFIIGSEAFVAFDLTGFDLNSEDTILARSLVLQSDWEIWDQKLAEVLSGNVAQSALNYGKRIPKRHRITKLRYLKSKLLEKEKVLSLLKREWADRRNPTITCYERESKIEIVKQSFKEYRTLSLKPLTSWKGMEDVIISNLVVAEPRKEEEREMMGLILNTLLDSNDWSKAVISIRSDILEILDSNNNLNKSIIRNDVNIKGLNATIVQIER